MEASESTCVPNPNNENSELEFQTSNSPNSDLDHAPSDDPNRTAEDHTVALHEELQKLDLKEESETVSKEEAEKDGNWDLKEVEQEQWVEKEKGDSNWEEEKGGESGLRLRLRRWWWRRFLQSQVSRRWRWRKVVREMIMVMPMPMPMPRGISISTQCGLRPKIVPFISRLGRASLHPIANSITLLEGKTR